MATSHIADETDLHRTLCGREVQTLLRGSYGAQALRQAKQDSPLCKPCLRIREATPRAGQRLATVERATQVKALAHLLPEIQDDPPFDDWVALPVIRKLPRRRVPQPAPARKGK